MGGTLTGAFHDQLKVSGSTSQTENPSISSSESIYDPRLPNELITEIFLRLPVKSLLKFKCISKSWLSRISSPEFIKSHFAISCKEGEYLNHQLLITSLCPTSCRKLCSLYSALHEAEPPTLVCDLQPRSNLEWIVGIVNGLVCIDDTTAKLCLWNPALRKSKYLPSPTVHLALPNMSVAVNYGFGYDVINDDYKVICVLRPRSSEFVSKYLSEDWVKVYSLRADSWRRNDDLRDLFPLYDRATYADGKMYWFVDVVEDSNQMRKLVSLDMASEMCGEVQQPDCETGYFDWKLGVFCGRLYGLSNYHATKLDIFVMDKYGAEETWGKVCSVPVDVNRLTLYSRERIICFVSDDEIVLRDGPDLFVYHIKLKESRSIRLNFGKPFSVVVPYVGSLVSPSPSP